jgi:hypothetical protein
MRRSLLALAFLVGCPFAQPMPTPTPTPTPTPDSTPTQPVQTPTPNPSPTPPPTPSPQPSVQTTAPANPNPNPMPPIELKPEDKEMITLKKKTTLKQTYNEYQKVEKAASIDKINLEKAMLEAKHSLDAQRYKNKQLEVQTAHPYYYNIPVSGVVGNMVITNSLVLKDGTVLKDKDRLLVQDGQVYVGGYMVSYPIMDNIKYPQVEATSSSSVPQLLTGMPTFNEGRGSPVGVPPAPPPPPPR